MPHLILIAGPNGAGKSTSAPGICVLFSCGAAAFIDQFIILEIMSLLTYNRPHE
jgi:predicted ABC-type ATPase